MTIGGKVVIIEVQRFFDLNIRETCMVLIIVVISYLYTGRKIAIMKISQMKKKELKIRVQNALKYNKNEYKKL